MSYQLKTKFGGTEAVIDDNCGVTKFYAIAHTLAEKLQVSFMNQIDDFESHDWDFKYKDEFLTLHYNIFEGVSIFPRKLTNKKLDNTVVTEVAYFLEKQAY
jgi:hypothetical protein